MNQQQNMVPQYFQAVTVGNGQSQQAQSSSSAQSMGIHQARSFFQPNNGSSPQFGSSNGQTIFHSPSTAFVSNSIAGGNQQPQPMRIVQAIPSTCTSVQQSATILTALNTVSTVMANANGGASTMQLLPSQHQADAEDRRIAALIDTYFVDQPTTSAMQPISTTIAVSGNHNAPGGLIAAPNNLVAKFSKKMGVDKRHKEEVKRAKQAEAARLRYHRLSTEEKRDLNVKRTLAQKRKRQREKEMEELEAILRQTNDIQEDPDVNEQLREKRMRARWAEAARSRYQRMSSEERRAHNNRRRMRQIAAAEGMKNVDGQPDEEAIRRHIREQNAKKAEAARLRYHRMTDDEKRAYNQRRTEAFRRRRMEEEMLLAMPIGRINGEALDRAQQIVVRNAKRAEAARMRYQRMTPEQRKVYNQKRYTPKRKRDIVDGEQSGGTRGRRRTQDDAFDALTTLERDVMKRTQQAQQALMRQQRNTTVTTAGAFLSTQIQGSVVQQPTNSVLTTHLQSQGATIQGQIQGQQMTAIPQQVQFQVQQIHPRQIQQQSVQQQQQQSHQSQIQYTQVQVSNGQMIVGPPIGQQIINPYTSSQPRA